MICLGNFILKNVKILGIRIDEVNESGALSFAQGVLAGDRPASLIFTPNPEMLVDARKDKVFFEILNAGDLNICDGRGAELVSGGKLKKISGADFMVRVCELAESMGKSVFLLGSRNADTVKKAADNLQKRFPSLKIAGWHPGHQIKNGAAGLVYDKRENSELIEIIKKSQPDILFVGFGHLKQEKWLYENLKKIPSLRIGMGVGGALDYLSGAIGRAPLFFRSIGLEWLWRLFREPKRLRRIWKATAVFLFLVFKDKIYGRKI